MGGGTNFTLGSIPEEGQKQKTEKKEGRLNDGNNNGQATHGARKYAWRTQATWANYKMVNIIQLSQYGQFGKQRILTVILDQFRHHFLQGVSARLGGVISGCWI